MQLSKNFSLSEMVYSEVAKKKGIDNTPSPQIIDNLKKLCEECLQPVRDKLKKPITINSGYRCSALNKAVGGASSSQHVLGEAVDITVGTKTANEDLFTLIVKDKSITFDQLIDESNYS